MDIRYFLGANTAEGFYSHYDQLLPVQSRRMVRILKGGSGCGKSTVMKKVAAHAEQLGMPVHRIFCSSDPDSLDGIVIPEVGYAIVDGTAPHVVDARLCGCSESYMDLGAGYDTVGLQSIRHVLEKLRQARQACYPKATACLRSIADLEQLTEPGTPIPTAVIDKEIPDQGSSGSIRTIFLSGHTPQGRMVHWDTVAALCPNVYVLRGTMMQITAFLNTAVSAAKDRGWNALVCDSSLLPGTFLEHLLIPDLGLAFVSDTVLSPYHGNRFRILGSYPENDSLITAQRTLLRSVVQHLRQAKAYHDLLEAAYAPYTDFTCANRAALDCCAELETLR